MANSALIGNRLRRIRKDRGLTQITLADQLGISASYLNLIEHNRRTITVPLLLRLSQLLQVDPHIFAPQQEGPLIGEMSDALKDPLFEEFDMTDVEIATLAAEQPEICQAYAKCYSAYRNLQSDLQVLNERLSQDLFLTDSSYRLRNFVTSILSFTEILHDNEDLSLEERRNFLEIMLKDSENLTDTVNEMLSFDTGDRVMGTAASLSPNEAVTDFIQAKENYFQELEDAAEEFRRLAGLDGPSTQARLIGYLQENHHVHVDLSSRDGHLSEFSFYDETKHQLSLSTALPQASIHFHLALLVGQLSYDSLLEELSTSAEITSDIAKQKAKSALANYFAGAVLLPYREIYTAAEDTRYDIELLEQRFGASYEQICHRLTTLQKPDARGIPLHLVRIDIAGNISKRFSASGLRIPRFGSSCPRWVIHSAFLTPNTIRSQISKMPDGATYFTTARTVTKPGLGFSRPKSHYAISLGCEISHAHRMIYSEGINLDAPKHIMPVGVSCRLCERPDCAQRAAPPPPQSMQARPQNQRNISPGIGEV
jgi:predicted transcriptional regulator/transcriptional regulator with XRE-family HTH domain